MATTPRKSTKAKTKTTKKPVTKSAKTNQKSVAVPAAKKTRVKQVARPDVAEQLRQQNIISAFISLGLAGVAAYFMGNHAVQVFTSLLTRDELTSRVITVLAPATRRLFDVELRWYVVAVMLLSAVLPILLLTVFKNQNEPSVARKINLWRLIDSAVIGSLVVAGVALLSGVQDIMTLLLMIGLIFVSAVLGWFAEKQNANKPGSARNIFVLDVFAGALPWLIIAGYAVGTFLFGMVRSPWYVYALYTTTALGFLAYAFNQNKLLTSTQDYPTSERKYAQIGTFIRVAFAVILIIGLQK